MAKRIPFKIWDGTKYRTKCIYLKEDHIKKLNEIKKDLQKNKSWIFIRELFLLLPFRYKLSNDDVLNILIDLRTWDFNCPSSLFEADIQKYLKRKMRKTELKKGMKPYRLTSKFFQDTINWFYPYRKSFTRLLRDARRELNTRKDDELKQDVKDFNKKYRDAQWYISQINFHKKRTKKLEEEYSKKFKKI